jgi:hypothetical protein
MLEWITLIIHEKDQKQEKKKGIHMASSRLYKVTIELQKRVMT